MYKNFNITEFEREEILNRLKENGYGQPINEQKTQTSQVAPTNALAIAKELLQNIIEGKKIFPIKTIPGYVGCIITKDSEIGYKQINVSDGSLRRRVTVNAFKVGNESDIVIFKKLQIGDDSVLNYKSPKDEVAAKATETDCPDATSYLQYLNTTPPNGKLSKMIMFFENDQFSNFELWRLTHYCISAGISVKEMLDVLKPFNPNIAKDIVDGWTYNNNFYNPTKGWDPNDQKMYNQVKSFADQSTTQGTPAQGQKPVAPQTQKPLNESQEILKNVFKSLIK